MIRIALSFSLTIWLAIPALAWTNPGFPEAKKLASEAQIKFMERDYESARTKYLAATEKVIDGIPDGKTDTPSDLMIASLFVNLGATCRAQKQYQDAEACFNKALWLQMTILGTSNPITQQTVAHYASLLRRMGKESSAIVVEMSCPVRPMTKAEIEAAASQLASWEWDEYDRNLASWRAKTNDQVDDIAQRSVDLAKKGRYEDARRIKSEFIKAAEISMPHQPSGLRP